MSKHNYSQYSNKKNDNRPNYKVKTPVEKPAMQPEITQSKPELVQETVNTVSLPRTVEGVVSGCAKLNVRAEANLFADVVCTLDAMSEIMIDVEKSNKDWFYVYTAMGREGYCMRKYVEAHL